MRMSPRDFKVEVLKKDCTLINFKHFNFVINFMIKSFKNQQKKTINK